MKIIHRTFFLSFLLISVFVISAWSQPMPANLKGQAVVTCFSGLDASGNVKNDFVAGLLNVHVPVGPGVNWPAPGYHGPSSTPWKSSILGQVFGIALDKRNNIYLTATSSYGHQTSNPYAYGAAGSGGVYQIDGTTGAINTGFITTTAYNTFAPTPSNAIGTSTIPNGNSTVHPGLGNICYDRVHDKLFVTNFEDGIIYSINPLTAKIDGIYDPVIAANPGGTSNPAMVADNASSLGFVPRGDRIWGIGYNRVDNRVYYAVWMEDQSSYTPTTYNIIRSIGLTATGAFKPASDDRFEIKMPDFLDPTNTSTIYNWSSPVSDIAFNTKGNILLAERSMASDDNPGAHVSRVLEYTGGSLSWSATPKVFYIGADIYYSNAAGGNDYAYRSYDTVTHTNLDCDSTVWITGDFLLNDPGFGGMVYGMQRSPASGNTTATVATTGYFIDFNGIPGTQDKTQIGDVRVYRDTCGSPDVVQGPCSSARVAAKPIQNGAAGGPCCYDVVLNNTTPNFWTNVTAQAITPGFVFASATVPTGWSLTNTGTIANWMPPGGFVPVGSTDSLIICINSTVPPVQKVEIVWHGVDGSVCRDTLTLDCPQMQPPIPPCAIVHDSSLMCTQSSSNGTIYQYCFTIKNNSPFSQAPYFYPAQNAMVWSSAPGVNVSPGLVNFPPLAFGATSAPLCFTLSGAGVHPGATVCIVVQLHGAANAQGDGFKWCCPPDTVCITLPPCKDCCDGFRKLLDKLTFATNGAGVTTLSSTVTAGPMPITKMTATIVSADIKTFGNAKFCASTGWLPASGDIINPPASIGGLPLVGVSQPFATPPPAPSREAMWGVVPSGVSFTGVPLAVQMQFPTAPPPFNGCYDSLRFCIRLTFTDTSCRTCDTM
ncbi:MAG TPA: hypothetical protein VEW28_11185, partial [Candidatus Kapabacteria bacterium]|nr:hypothetical protein [Candidatus Kapabacteria bacterium]